LFDVLCRWVHRDCASLSGPPEEKCICVLCKEIPDEVPVESEVSSTNVDEKADSEVPMELGMFFNTVFNYFKGLYKTSLVMRTKWGPRCTYEQVFFKLYSDVVRIACDIAFVV